MAMVVNGDAAVEVVLSSFSIEAVKRAAYALMAQVDIAFHAEGDRIICALKPVSADPDVSVLERDFRREVLDQELRMSIEQSTHNYRDAILGLAFSRTGLQDG